MTVLWVGTLALLQAPRAFESESWLMWWNSDHKKGRIHSNAALYDDLAAKPAPAVSYSSAVFGASAEEVGSLTSMLAAEKTGGKALTILAVPMPMPPRDLTAS